MQRAGVWAVSIILLAGALSIVVAMTTVEFLYPNITPVAEATTATTQSAPKTPSDTAAEPKPAPAQQPVTVAAATTQAQAPAGSSEALALEVIQLASSGDMAGALARTTGLTEETLTAKIGRLKPTPVRVSSLPGGKVLVWADYRREGLVARGNYQVTVAGGKVIAVDGPFAPEGGYRTGAVKPIDLNGQSIDLATYKGKGIVLVAPRLPEPGLADTLAALQKQFAPQGVEVVLALDIGAPDWAGTAKAAGFSGPIWRFKSRLDDVPMVNKGRWLGAVGLLLDQDGVAVASLTVLDPTRYDSSDSVTAAVLKAYGLLP